MKEENLEQLFRNNLSDIEADVNPDVWSNVKQGIQSPVQPTHTPANSWLAKSASVFSKMSMNSIVFITAASVTIIGATIYLLNKKSDSPATSVVASMQEVKNDVSIPVEKTEPPVPINNIPEEKISQQVKTATPVQAKENKNDVSANTNEEHVRDAKDKSVPQHVAPANPKITDQNSQHKNNSASPATASSEEPVANETESEKNPPVNNQASSDDNSKPDLAVDQIEKYLLPENGDVSKGLPNVFTPNGDGRNDIFTLNTINLKSLEVTVFDQAFNTVYSWKSLTGGWNGKLSNGQDAPTGNYFYSLSAETIDGRICIAQSFLQLIKLNK